MKFPYFVPEKGVIKPWIPVRLGFRKTHKILPANAVALLDTGADVCFVSDEIATWLGFSEKGKKSVSFTAANNEPFGAYPEKFVIYLGREEFECQFFVSRKLPKESPIILGTHGFFDRHSVTFDGITKEITITKGTEN